MLRWSMRPQREVGRGFARMNADDEKNLIEFIFV
jgi:hypothetical protein